jgi:hypothetical protein
LGSRKTKLATGALEARNDPHGSRVEIDVAPAQPERLTPAQSRGGRERERDVIHGSFGCREDRPHGLRVGDGERGSLRSWRGCCQRGVRGDDLPADTLAESHGEDAVDVLAGMRTQPGGERRVERGLDVHRTELREGDATDTGEDVAAQQARVPLVGPRSDAGCGMGEPAVLAIPFEGHPPRIGNEALVEVAQHLREFPFSVSP